MWGFVFYTDESLVVAEVKVRIWNAWFCHQNDNTGATCCAKGALDTHLLYFIAGMSYTSRINESEADIPNCDDVLNGVACGTLYVGNNGAFFSQKLVEECTFTHVGGADNGHRDTLLEGIAGME